MAPVVPRAARALAGVASEAAIQEVLTDPSRETLHVVSLVETPNEGVRRNPDTLHTHLGRDDGENKGCLFSPPGLPRPFPPRL